MSTQGGSVAPVDLTKIGEKHLQGLSHKVNANKQLPHNFSAPSPPPFFKQAAYFQLIPASYAILRLASSI